MSAGVYANINGVTRKGKKLYAKVNGVVRPIKELWVKVNGVSRRVYQATPKLINTDYKFTYYSSQTSGLSASIVGDDYKAHFGDENIHDEIQIYPIFDKSFTITEFKLYASRSSNGTNSGEHTLLYWTALDTGHYRISHYFYSDGSEFFSGSDTGLSEKYTQGEKSICFYVQSEAFGTGKYERYVKVAADITTLEYGTFKVPLIN